MSQENTQPDVRGAPDEAVLEAVARLLRESQSLILASSDEHGQPLASYAPFVAMDAALHVFVSRLAAHSANLARKHPVSVMVIEDQVAARQPFARARLITTCTVQALAADGPHTPGVLDALQRRFGAVVHTLRQLPDFTLYRLSPASARFVQGFGQAFELAPIHLTRILGDAGS